MLKVTVYGIASNSVVIYCIVVSASHLAVCNNKCKILTGHCAACNCVCDKCTTVRLFQIHCGYSMIEANTVFLLCGFEV